MKTTAELMTALIDVKVASVDLDGVPARDARRRLIGAAKAAGVRVKVGRTVHPDGECMTATVLEPEDAAQQARRAAALRACRCIGEAISALTTEFPGGGDYDPADDVHDLLEIKGDLEASLSPGGTE